MIKSQKSCYFLIKLIILWDIQKLNYVNNNVKYQQIIKLTKNSLIPHPQTFLPSQYTIQTVFFTYFNVHSHHNVI